MLVIKNSSQAISIALDQAYFEHLRRYGIQINHCHWVDPSHEQFHCAGPDAICIGIGEGVTRTGFAEIADSRFLLITQVVKRERYTAYIFRLDKQKQVIFKPFTPQQLEEAQAEYMLAVIAAEQGLLK